MRTFFMMPPGDNSHNPITIGGASGRVYSCALGATVQVNGDADREALLANGWALSSAGGSGATSARPDPASTREFHDTTLGKLIVSDGKTWRDPHTGAAV